VQCVAVCCSELQCVAAGCSGLQWVAVGCSVLQCVDMQCVDKTCYILTKCVHTQPFALLLSCIARWYVVCHGATSV